LNTGLSAMAAADPEETKTGRPSVIAKRFNRLIHGWPRRAPGYRPAGPSQSIEVKIASTIETR
jgi:hypothetical protein